MSFFGNKYALAGIAVAATAVGYCIYFDQKRRLAPGFKEKLAEKRRLEKERKEEEEEKANISVGLDGMPTQEQMKDQRALKQFFVETMAAGQSAMHSGDTAKAAQCFVNALRVYQDPVSLLQVLKQTVPPELFLQVVQKLQTIPAQHPDGQ
eukprot:gene8450-10231_t